MTEMDTRLGTDLESWLGQEKCCEVRHVELCHSPAEAIVLWGGEECEHTDRIIYCHKHLAITLTRLQWSCGWCNEAGRKTLKHVAAVVAI